MKQGKGKDNVDCIACVCCMITNKSLKYFKEWHTKNINKERPEGYTDYDIYYYLVVHGYILGIGVQPRNNHIDSENDILTAEIKPFGLPAYLAVKSERCYWAGHAIYWNGRQVFDPNPEVLDGRPLSDYKIKVWTPVIKMIEKDEYDVSDKEMYDEVNGKKKERKSKC